MRITPEYQAQQQAMHENPKLNYGTAGAKYGDEVSQIIDLMEIDHLLDYGCGHNLSLRNALHPERAFRYQGYDPGVPEYASDPVPAQMVACIDVLEHIESECLDAVLDHLAELTEQVGFFTIHTGPAGKVLPDGRNAHLIQQPPEWWLPKIQERFELKGFNGRLHGFEVLVLPREWDVLP